MTDSILNNKRRLERHSRRDGNLQSRARPIMMERKDEHEDASSVAFIRSFVENAQQQGVELSKRLGPGFSFGGGGDDEDGTSTSTRDSGSTRGGSSGSGSDTGSATTSSAGGRQSSATSTTSSDRNIIDSILDSATRTSTSSRSSTSTTSTSTRSSTSSTPTSTRSTSSAILTTTAAASSTSSIAPTTSVAFVTASPTQSVDNAAASSTGKAESSGPGAGPIIGIVAGSLAGIAVIAVIVGFLFKKFGRKEDPYEADPFERDDFRRQSAMLPETFDSDDGHPSMSEHNNLHNSMGPFSDAGYAGAGAAVGGMAAASSFASHNESGGPRPPTMFQKHINGPGAQYNMNDAPQVGAIYNPNDLTPQLPPMAFGGSDPYSIAGVGRNHQLDGNMNNPYAHLDRSMSNSMQQQQQQQHQPAQDGYEGQDMYADLNRNGSNGSYSNEQYRSANDFESSAHGYNTTGRPGTAEGRSGTPDLPNVQQTYALGDGSENDHPEMERVVSPHRMAASPQHMSQDMYGQYQQYQTNPFNEGGSPPQQTLQVRNLLPNPHDAQHRQQAQRPISSVSSQPADDDAAYGGVW